jgi:hypothetical protein
MKWGQGQSAHHRVPQAPRLTGFALNPIELKRIERACMRLLRPQARRSWLKKLDHVSNTRAERAAGSVFYPMHFISKMTDHQGCAPFARAAYRLPSREQQRPTGFGGTADLALKVQEHARYARLIPRAIPIGYAVPREMEPMDATGAD